MKWEFISTEENKQLIKDQKSCEIEVVITLNPLLSVYGDDFPFNNVSKKNVAIDMNYTFNFCGTYCSACFACLAKTKDCKMKYRYTQTEYA